MDEELISKKDLLELTGISYGQLYRWKRKNLLPEEWFIRKSAFTGQETFFPKQMMLARIDKIKNMKDDLSLDELAEVFSPVPTDLRIDRNELMKRNIVSLITAEYAEPIMGPTQVYTFEQALYLYVFDFCLQSGEMNLDEGKHLLQTLSENYPKFDGKPSELIFMRKMGMSVFLLLSSGSELYTENSVKLVLRVHMAKKVEELKMKITAV
ncbi:YhbD family protein [Paenibacillus aceris]|uniref:DNA-binding transcriptional MerR regulator n=1 Tax=Paenibacillus aceris TaxID=869555 RepID=A0ABS4HVR7_9BACL|nr:YhbD family protein [Paenibacillus aceris]MBP1962737.1 DNA-binding transcriptional MerR regulator [Paenibacillus aceris]NHW33900.1 YhbD family protein [Paenibacillus aceris]